MMNFKIIITKCMLFVGLTSFTQCASSQNIDTTAPIMIKEPYFQKWIAGIEEAGSGFVIYLPVEESTDIILKYVYFRKKKIELKLNNKSIYIGRYTSYPNKKRDLIMSDDPKEEFKNTLPIVEEEIPFKLTSNECVVVYTKNKKEGFFKIDTLPEKKVKAMPMQRRQ